MIIVHAISIVHASSYFIDLDEKTIIVCYNMSKKGNRYHWSFMSILVEYYERVTYNARATKFYYL